MTTPHVRLVRLVTSSVTALTKVTSIVISTLAIIFFTLKYNASLRHMVFANFCARYDGLRLCVFCVCVCVCVRRVFDVTSDN
jgi:hypothetical protein